MHFGKTYASQLESLPAELRHGVIEYRALKKLIRQVVDELGALGLSPDILQSVRMRSPAEGSVIVGDEEDTEVLSKGQDVAQLLRLNTDDRAPVEVVYEFHTRPDGTLEPRIRLCVISSSDADVSLGESPPPELSTSARHEYVLPLSSDTAFYTMLSSELSSLSALLSTLHASFHSSLPTLSSSISQTAVPLSASSRKSFKPLSSLTPSGQLTSRSGLSSHGPSDLTAWRSIFSLYADSEIFVSLSERDRGERSLPETEARLSRFVSRLSADGLDRALVLPSSRQALHTFLQLNASLLHIRKLQYLSSEATRKILKKHSKRTLLPLPSTLVLPAPSSTLPLALLQSLTEVLALVPSPTDYSCPVCASLALLPIRLACSHVFCVRCLTKLQRANKADCPVCRAPSVLVADRRNVDVALVNFMKDWFPLEAREKLKENANEVVREQEEAWKKGGGGEGCVVM